MALIDEVKTRLGGATSQRLIELTNPDGTATTIDDTVLGVACTDAEGHFRRETGLEPDETLDFHVHLLVLGAIGYLEVYKGRSAGIMDSNMERFERGLAQLRARRAILWQTNSVLDPSTDTSGAKPDMDRKGKLQYKELKENVYSPRKTLTEDD